MKFQLESSWQMVGRARNGEIGTVDELRIAYARLGLRKYPSQADSKKDSAEHERFAA
jgi:hypothetical protein